MGFSTLQIGASALLTSQYALNIVGNNIANSSTEGYSRQIVETAASVATYYTFGAVSAGVDITTISSVTDEYLESQIRSATSTTEYLSTLQTCYEKLEVYYNELSDNDLSTAMDDYWSAMSDVSDNVEDVSTRLAFLEQAQSVASVINALDANLTELHYELNDEIEVAVEEVNAILSEIAELNADIVKAEAGGASSVNANDLRDQRTVLLKSLSEYMDATIYEEDNGSITVTMSGTLLVYGNNAYEIEAETEIVDGVQIVNPVMAETGVTLKIGEGSLAALIEMRDEILPSYQEELDELAATLIWETNRIISQGTGLSAYDSITGSTIVLEPENTLDELVYDFTPVDGTYEITNGSFELLVYDTTSGEITTLSIDIDLDGNDAEADTILYDSSDPTASNSLINMIQEALDSVANGAFTVSLSRTGQIEIESETSQYQFGFGTDTSGVVAALGLNTLFTGYDATTIDVSETMLDEPSYLGCGTEFTEGDNTTINELVELRDEAVMSNGSATMDDFYEAIISRLGVEGETIDTEYETQADVLTYVENQREELSGVSLDEELTLMIQYQRSYQSAARFISTVNECYETLISM